MKLTCLSKGCGYHFPPCYIIDIGGFRILLDCPLDLSALAIFSPVPAYSVRKVEEFFDCSCHVSKDTDCGAPKRQKVERPLDASSLIFAVPWYKTVSNLHLWDVSFIDVVLVSSAMGMLGLPFLTRSNGFSAKIYATEATRRMGQLMMEDLLFMHREFKQFYGPAEPGFPQWMKWEELDKLPSSLQEIISGNNGTELSGWLSLYSADDVKGCIQKVEPLKYAEETCYGGSLIIKAFSSGLDIGTANWVIRSTKREVTFLSSSVLTSSQAMSFDYHALEGYGTLLYSDFSALNAAEVAEEEINHSAINGNATGSADESLLNPNENAEEEEKLAFISSHAIESLKAGGSVLIPIGRIGVIFQLLEQISFSEEFSTLKKNFYCSPT